MNHHELLLLNAKGRAASWLARLSSVAPHKSRVRIPAGANFHLWVKKSPSLCSPQGMALGGMGQGSGGFSTAGEAVVASS